MSSEDIALSDYVVAPSGTGPLAHVWANEPFRLVYDLCREIERLRAEVERLRAALGPLRMSLLNAPEEARRG